MIEQKLLSVVDFLWGKQRNETIHFFLLTWREGGFTDCLIVRVNYQGQIKLMASYLNVLIYFLVKYMHLLGNVMWYCDIGYVCCEDAQNQLALMSFSFELQHQ